MNKYYFMLILVGPNVVEIPSRSLAIIDYIDHVGVVKVTREQYETQQENIMLNNY